MTESQKDKIIAYQSEMIEQLTRLLDELADVIELSRKRRKAA